MTETPHNIENPSIGGDVADLLGNLKRIETSEPYHGSLNPHGDPYADHQTAQDIIKSFARTHPDSLDILGQKIDSFYETKSDVNKPQIYIEAKKEIQKLLNK